MSQSSGERNFYDATTGFALILLAVVCVLKLLGKI